LFRCCIFTLLSQNIGLFRWAILLPSAKIVDSPPPNLTWSCAFATGSPEEFGLEDELPPPCLRRGFEAPIPLKQFTNPDWWFVRAASMLRKLYLRGPIGVSRMRKFYGGRHRPGMSPPYFARRHHCSRTNFSFTYSTF
jgi:hypothetical protein